MSCDLGRLKSASALRDWEEDRAKAFASWASASRELLESLRAAVDLGATQHLELQQLLSLRSVADRAYAQALAAGLPSKEDDSAPSSPVLAAVAALQRSVSQLREAFALNVVEGSLLTALANASSEFKTTAEGLLAKLGKGVSEAEQVNQHVQEAMSNFRRASIQDPRRRTPAAAGGWFAKPEPRSDPDDGWLQEHRYRRAVASLRERQRTFTADLCSAVEELRRLELWREEVVRKVLATFCTKLHQVETSVQSLANDGIKAMAGSGRDDGSHVVMKEMEKALNADLAGTAAVQASATSGGDEVWPALRSLRALGRLGQHPPSSVLGKLSGALQAPRRWAGPQLRVVVLTKDAWLHCFHLEASRLQALSASASAGGGVGADVHGTGVEGLEALEAEPQWSLFVPHCNVVAPVAGKARCFEIEESQKRFLRSSRKEMLQAETDESLLRWVKALVEAGAENKSTLQLAAAARPPPPPPPPPKIAEASSSSATPQLNEEPPHIEAPCSSSLEDEQPTQSPQQNEEDAAEPAVDTEVDAGAADGSTEDPSLPRPAQHHLTAEDVFGE